MGKRLGVLVVLILGIAASGYLAHRLWDRARRAHAREQFKQRWAEEQCSREIVCDYCSASTTGLVLNRAQTGVFQVCPECGREAGRPVVYYFCQKPGCDRCLVKVRRSVWTDDGQSPGDRVVCPNCGDVRGITPLFLDLRSAHKIANETEQEFP